MTEKMRQEMELTDLDRAILDVLTRDPHATVRAIADTTGAAMTLVTSRIRALDRRAVSRVLAVLDLKASGQMLCFVLLGVRGRPIDKVAAEIAPMRNVMLISTLNGGAYDLLILVRFTDMGGLHDILTKHIGTIDGVFQTDVSIVLDVPRFSPHYVMYASGLPEAHGDAIESLERELPDGLLDELDRRIVTELQHDARQSINTIARKCAINASTIRYRIRNLESRGLMRFITVLDPAAIGLHAFALVEIEPEANRLAEVVEKLRECPWMPQIFVTTGRAPIKGIFQAGSMEAISAIKSEELTTIGGILNVTVSTLVSTRKMDVRWAQQYV